MWLFRKDITTYVLKKYKMEEEIMWFSTAQISLKRKCHFGAVFINGCARFQHTRERNFQTKHSISLLQPVAVYGNARKTSYRWKKRRVHNNDTWVRHPPDVFRTVYLTCTSVYFRLVSGPDNDVYIVWLMASQRMYGQRYHTGYMRHTCIIRRFL